MCSGLFLMEFAAWFQEILSAEGGKKLKVSQKCAKNLTKCCTNSRKNGKYLRNLQHNDLEICILMNMKLVLFILVSQLLLKIRLCNVTSGEKINYFWLICRH